jgi:FkbM family methyltransferase
MSAEPKSTSARAASLIGRKLPCLTATALRLLAPVLPNLWLFYSIVGECNLKVATGARLGNGMKIRVFLGDMIGCHIWHSGWYEPQFVEALRPFLTPDVTFFDLGANIGQYTLLSAPLVQEVHSFEPFAGTYKLLEWNVRHNHLANVHLNELAVSDRAGQAMIYEGDASNTGGYSLRPSRTGTDRQYSIRTIPLDQYVFGSDLHSRLRKIVLKIDIEGAELMALQGASKLLGLKPVIFLEAIDELQKKFGDSVTDLTGFLQARGYTLRSLSEKGPVPYTSSYPNILALPPN